MQYAISVDTFFVRGNALKYLQFTQTWLFTRRTVGLSPAEEATFAARLEEVWDLLSDQERAQVERALAEDSPDDTDYLVSDLDVPRGEAWLPRASVPGG